MTRHTEVNNANDVCLERARSFSYELMDVAETYTGLAIQYGPQALSLCLYLQQSLLDEQVGGVDLYGYNDLACTGFMAILNEMPSHEEWLSYVITDNQ